MKRKMFLVVLYLFLLAPPANAEPERGCGNYINYNDLVMAGTITPTNAKHHQDILNWRNFVKETYGERIYQWVGLVENCWHHTHWPRAVCVLNGESKGRVDAVGKNRNSSDLGLWQINNYFHRGKLARHSWRWQDPVVNTLIAKEVFDEAEKIWGNGWKPWYACRR